MTGNTRFRQEALEHRHGQDGLGSVLDGRSFFRSPRHFLRPEAWRAYRGNRGRARIPICYQTQVSDCGPACLVMTLRHHGIDAELDQIRELVSSGTNGSSARSLLEAARSHGLKGRGVRADLDGLQLLPPGSILFWNFNHFVVLERSTRNYTDVVDPAVGHRRLSRESIAKAFTGVAIEFEAPIAPAALPGTSKAVKEPSRRRLQATPWHRLQHLIPPKKELTRIAAVSMVLLGFEFALPLAISFLVGHVLPGRLNSRLSLVTVGLGVLCALFLVLQIVRSSLLVKRQAAIEKSLTWGIVEHLTALPYDFFTVHSSGDLAMRVRTGSNLNRVLSITAVSAALDSILIAVYLVAILVVDPVLACLVIGLIAGQVGVLSITWRQQTRMNYEVLEQQTRTQNELMDMLESITTLKAAGVEGEAAERWSHVLVREVNTRLSTQLRLSVCTSLSRALQFVAPIAVLLVGTWRALAGDASLGGTIAFMTLTIALFAPLESLFDAAAQLASVGPALARLDDILRAKPEPRGLPTGRTTTEAAAIRTEGLSFQYAGSHRPALSDVNVTIEPGQFVAVLGRSGSGKSTLGMLLAALRVPTGGTVMVDGTDLATVDRPSYRRKIGYVNQNAHLFAGSIRENITFGLEDVTEDDVVKVVKLARIHEELTAFPMGYDTLVGPGGHGLSGGQRQRVILARALARKPRLLVLDEASGALDPVMEKEIFHGLMKSGITVVAIAHRLTVLEYADQVLVVREGKIVEKGTPAWLKENGSEFLCLS
ncbi:peptidase domain-containing ABC transporter [Streptomyces pseudovenezuelae]|nr:peptidase domain-containing ABC transporter [Streptomyces pseudovenezuelae]